jgi:hypothetical protein
MTTFLKDYLATLNSSETQRGIWVNPHDLNDFRIGQYCFDNGGVRDDKVCIGSLDSLSCGYQSTQDILQEILECGGVTYKEVTFNKKNCNFTAFIEAYIEGKLATELQEQLESQIQEVHEEWSMLDADAKIDELEEYFAEDGGEYWKVLERQELEAEAYISWENEQIKIAQAERESYFNGVVYV